MAKMHSTSAPPIVNPQEDAGICFAAEIIDAERSLIAIGWLNCEDLNDAGFLTGLAGHHFACPLHAGLYAYLCWKADHARRPDIDEAVAVLGAQGIPIDVAELLWLIETYAIEPLTNPKAERDLQRLASAVIRNNRRVEEYRSLLARAQSLLDRDPSELVRGLSLPAGNRPSKRQQRGFAYV